MLADGWRDPVLFAQCCGSKPHPCSKCVAEQTQTEQMEQFAVPTWSAVLRQKWCQPPAATACSQYMFVELSTDYSDYLMGQCRIGSRQRCGIVSDSVDVCECVRKAVSQAVGWESPMHLSMCSSAAASLQRQHGTPVRESCGSARASS